MGKLLESVIEVGLPTLVAGAAVAIIEYSGLHSIMGIPNESRLTLDLFHLLEIDIYTWIGMQIYYCKHGKPNVLDEW